MEKLFSKLNREEAIIYAGLFFVFVGFIVAKILNLLFA